MNAKDCFQAGDLQGAIAAAADEVKRNPMQTSPRALLAELLCFSGDLERADKHLDAIGQQDAEAMLAVAALRQLVRAELSRREFYEPAECPNSSIRRHHMSTSP